jgi:HEPN domain-containing protein
MNPLTEEWVTKAESDRATAERELQVSAEPNLDAVCFHSQQCVEKYFKAILHEARILFPKTHDLSTLLNLILPTKPSWRRYRADLQELTTFAISYRYPGLMANKKVARKALADCKRIRRICRHSLGLPK